MEILYVILGIILIIAIMAFTGYYLEKKQKNVVEQDKNINIVFDDAVEHKNENAATNADIPEVLNFNDIEEYENRKEQNNNITYQETEIPEVINFSSVESVKNEIAEVEENVTEDINLENNGKNVIEFDIPVQETVENIDNDDSEVPDVMNFNPVESNEIIQGDNVIQLDEPVADIVENSQIEATETTELPSEDIDVVQIEESVQETEKNEEIAVEDSVSTDIDNGNQEENIVSDLTEIRQDIVVDEDSVTIPDDF